eukprot:g7016.t1
MPRKLIPGSPIQLPGHEALSHQHYSPSEMKREFASSSSAQLQTVHRDTKPHMMPKRLDVDEQPEYLRLQEERRTALWDEVHGGFRDLVGQFEDFHDVLTGDVATLGDRLSEKHKRMIQEKLDREKYVKGLEDRIKQLLEEKQYFQKVMEAQYKMTNCYFQKFKENEANYERMVNMEGVCRRLDQKAKVMQESAVKWRRKYEKLKTHHDRMIRNLELWMQREIKKIQRQQLLSAWETDTRITKIVDALDDSEKRLVVEREHWMKAVADVRAQLQDEKNVTNARRKRMRTLGEKALYRLRVLINPGSRPDLHKVCFRHWALEALRADGRIRDLRRTQDCEQENKFLKLQIEEFEAFQNDLNPQLWDMYMAGFSELQHENTELSTQLRETRWLAHEEFLTQRNVRLVDERTKWRGRLRALEERMRRAWSSDVSDIYEECYYLQQRNANLEKLANDGVEETHGKKVPLLIIFVYARGEPLYAVVPKDVGIRCIDCCRKIVLQEERKKVPSASTYCAPVSPTLEDLRASRSQSPEILHPITHSPIKNRTRGGRHLPSASGIPTDVRHLLQHGGSASSSTYASQQLQNLQQAAVPTSARSPREHEMVPWSGEERARVEDLKWQRDERMREEAEARERRRRNSEGSAWGAFDIVEVPSVFQWSKEEDDDKPFPFSQPYSRKNVVKKASEQAKVLKKEFLEQFFEKERDALPTLGWDASVATEATRKRDGGGGGGSPASRSRSSVNASQERMGVDHSNTRPSLRGVKTAWNG